MSAPDFGPWQVRPATQNHAEWHFRAFLAEDAYRPRFYVLPDRGSGGFEVKVEGPTPGAIATAQHVPTLGAARELPDEPHADPRNGRVVISNEMIDHSRWSVHHELVFRLVDQPPGEAWSVTYSVGAAESQDETPWEHEDEIEATLVHEVEKVVKVWVVAP